MCEMWQLTDDNLNDQTQMAKTITTATPPRNYYQHHPVPRCRVAREEYCSFVKNGSSWEQSCWLFFFILLLFVLLRDLTPNSQITHSQSEFFLMNTRP